MSKRDAFIRTLPSAISSDERGTDISTIYPLSASELYPGVQKNAVIAKSVAQKYGLSFVPLQSVFDSLCLLKPSDYWLIDGIHPTHHGHEIIAEQLIKEIIRIKDN